MLRGAAPTAITDRQLDRLIRVVLVVLVIGFIGFVAFYVADRVRLPQPGIVDREIAALEDAVRVDPADIASRGRLAEMYLRDGRFADAVAQYDAVIGATTGLPQAHLGRGRALVASGEFDRAAADFDAVVALTRGGEMANVDPMLQAAYYWLGSIALEQGHAEEAIEHLRGALHINGSDADALYLIGTAYVDTGQPDRAIEALRSAVAFVPSGWAEPYATLARAYTATGQEDLAAWASAMATLASGDDVAAEAGLRPLVDSQAAVDANIGLALTMELRGDSSAAAGWYRAALELDPANVSAQMGLGRVGGPASPSDAPVQVQP